MSGIGRGGAASAGAIGLGALVVVGCAAFTWWPVLSLGHFGWDTWPAIATSRVLDWGDWLGIWTEPLMDGRYPRGDFYRPVASLSLALDYALWGDRALGYHGTDLLVCIATGLGVAAVGRRRLGLGLGAWLAAVMFVLHPAQLEVLPVSARRPDALSLGFALWALAVWPRAEQWNARRAVAAGVGCALSLGSKETGVIALPLLFAFAAAEGQGGPVHRLREAARRCAIPAACVAVVLAARLAVLGGIGGHGDASIPESLLAIPRVLGVYAVRTVLPQPLSPGVWWVGGLVTAVAVGLGVVAWASPDGAARKLGLLAVWFAAVAGVTALGGKPRSWYALAFVPGYALAFGVVVESARAVRPGSAAFVAVVVVAVAMGSPALGYSPAVRDYREWRALDAEQRAFLEEFDRAVAATPPGAVARVRGLPSARPPLADVGVREASGLAPYSVQAYAELHHPELPVRVVSLDDGAAPEAVEGRITVGVGH